MSDAELVPAIADLWGVVGRYDTFDIARILKVPESRVYNLLPQARWLIPERRRRAVLKARDRA